MKNDLAGCDMALSVTQEQLNDQLSFLHEDRHIEQEIDIGGERGAIKAAIKAHEIALSVNDDQRPTEWTCTLIVEFGRGTFKGPGGEHSTNNWRLAMFVKIDHAHIESHDHVERLRVQPETKVRIKSFDPEVFKVRRLYMELRGRVGDSIDRRHTQLSPELSPEDLQVLYDLVHGFLAPRMAGLENHYHLGFIVLHTHTKASATRSLEFKPTGLRLAASVAHDSKQQRHVVLNYLLMTENREFPAGPLALAPIRGVDSNYLRIAEARFANPLFMGHLSQVMATAPFVWQSGVRYKSVGPQSSGTAYDHQLQWFQNGKYTLREDPLIDLTATIEQSQQYGKHTKIRAQVTLRRHTSVVLSGIWKQTDNLESTRSYEIVWRLYIKGHALMLEGTGAPQPNEHRIPGLTYTNMPPTTSAQMRWYGSGAINWTGWRELGDRCEAHFLDYTRLHGVANDRGSTQLRAENLDGGLTIKLPIRGVFMMKTPELVADPLSKACQLLVPLEYDGT